MYSSISSKTSLHANEHRASQGQLAMLFATRARTASAASPPVKEDKHEIYGHSHGCTIIVLIVLEYEYYWDMDSAGI